MADSLVLNHFFPFCLLLLFYPTNTNIYPQLTLTPKCSNKYSDKETYLVIPNWICRPRVRVQRVSKRESTEWEGDLEGDWEREGECDWEREGKGEWEWDWERVGEWEWDDSEIERVRGRLRKWEWWESKTKWERGRFRELSVGVKNRGHTRVHRTRVWVWITDLTSNF